MLSSQPPLVAQPKQKFSLFNSRFILREKRFVWLDYDKGISIILVAYGHCFAMLYDHNVDMSAYPFINYIGVFLYGFRMPLFFIVSGVLISKSLQKRGLKAYLFNRISNILFPLFVWGFIQISISLISSKYTHTDIKPIAYLNLLIDPRQTGHFWYLNALFFIGVIYSFLKAILKIKPLIQLLVGAVFFSIAGYIHIHNLNAGLFTDIFEYYVFFALGDLISKIFLNQTYVEMFTSWKICLPLLLIFIVIQYKAAQFNLNGGVDGINFVEHKMPLFYLIEALVGCSLSLSISFLLQKHRVLSFLRVVGFHSLFIYCMQIIVMSIVRMVLLNALKITNVPLLFLTVWSSGIIIPLVFYNVCLKLNMWWLFSLNKPNEHYEFVKQQALVE